MKHKVLGWAALAFILFMISKDPHGSAVTAGHLGDWLAGMATSVGDFLTALSAGGGQ